MRRIFHKPLERGNFPLLQPLHPCELGTAGDLLRCNLIVPDAREGVIVPQLALHPAPRVPDLEGESVQLPPEVVPRHQVDEGVHEAVQVRQEVVHGVEVRGFEPWLKEA